MLLRLRWLNMLSRRLGDAKGQRRRPRVQLAVLISRLCSSMAHTLVYHSHRRHGMMLLLRGLMLGEVWEHRRRLQRRRVVRLLHVWGLLLLLLLLVRMMQHGLLLLREVNGMLLGMLLCLGRGGLETGS